MSNTWSYQTPSPVVKFENSPTESFMSTPAGEGFSNLFETTPMTSTMNPRDIMTPESTHGDDRHREFSHMSADTHDTTASTPEPGASEKKPTKKRKSWGQVLPEPKTNLPPRKRAKTEDEKEQRRVERVLRNRRAAQSSRERKRLEVEALEKKNQELSSKLDRAQQMIEELVQVIRSSGASSDALRTTPITFSHELFNSQDGHMTRQPTTELGPSLMEGILSASHTLNPKSLSPTLAPVPEEVEDWQEEDDEPSTPAAASLDAHTPSKEASTDTTQLPAVKLCSDLPCRSVEVPPQSWLTAWSLQQQQLWLFLTLFLPIQLLASTSWILSTCQHPLVQITMSMKAGFSLPPTPAILNTIIWLVTTPRHTSHSQASAASTTSTSTSSSPTTSATACNNSSSSTVPTAAEASTCRFSPSLRLKTLRKILSCSPQLARPLRAATLEVLRWVNPESPVNMARGAADASAPGPDVGLPSQPPLEYVKHNPLNTKKLPSYAVCMSLLLAIEVEMRKLSQRKRTRTFGSGTEHRLASAARFRTVKVEREPSEHQKAVYSGLNSPGPELGFNLNPKSWA